mgnify:CR=1 FL=1
MSNTKSATYRDAGVDIDAGNRLIERIKPLVKATNRPGVLGGIGGCGGLFEPDLSHYQPPVLVPGADRAGTPAARIKTLRWREGEAPPATGGPAQVPTARRTAANAGGAVATRWR